jgi:hypothetical protein
MSEEDRHPADWPHPNERPCDQCGHVWFAGERRHDYVEHGGERPEEVMVLCRLCRQQRGLPRADPEEDEQSSAWGRRRP